MTTTRQKSPTTSRPNRYRGPVTAAAAFVAILAVAVVFLVFAGDGDELRVADTQPTPTTLQPAPTTVASEPEAMTGLQVIEEAVAAYYSGDADRAVELFELSDRSDDEIRTDSAYQAAIDGRLTLYCAELSSDPEQFNCRTPYHNVLTDAIGHIDRGDTNRVVIEDGVITSFGFPEHTFIVAEIGTLLALEGRFEGYEHCVFGPFPESCARIQIENLDRWVEWQDTVEPEAVVESALESWYGGDCLRARHLSQLAADTCALDTVTNQTIEYESILEAEVSLDSCEAVTSNSPDAEGLSCEVSYSNAMSAAVGRPPSVTVKHFDVWLAVSHDGLDIPWHAVDYPEDAELRESFKLFAESGELEDGFAAANCATARTPECAHLIVDNLDDWAAWYETNA